MKIFVNVKPSATKERVDKIDINRYVVAVTSPPVNGKANQAVIKALSKYLGVSESRINIVSGYTSKQKVIEIS